MESEQVQMYQISKPEESNNKGNVVLRTLIGDPDRYKPQVSHPEPSTLAAQEPIPASMYTLETRYRPIPAKVLPKQTEPQVYYIDSQKEGPPTSEPTPPILREEPEVPKNMVEEQEPPPTIFLEPEVILQPVLYSIVGKKTLPIQNPEPILVDQEKPLPILYTITGQPHPPPIDMSLTTLNLATTAPAPAPAPEKLPILYTLVANPRLQVPIQESIKQMSQVPVQESVKQVPKQYSPTLHSIVGNPTIPPYIEQTNTLYSPPLAQPAKVSSMQPILVQEPVKQASQVPKQYPPTLHSIVGNPTLPPYIEQTNILGSPPLTQPAEVSSMQPIPILYTVVGETQVPNNIPKENRPPVAPIKRQTNDVITYTVVGDPSISQSRTIPNKTQPLQQQKQQQQAQVPSLYPLVGKPNSVPEQNTETRPKPVIQKKPPPPAIVPTRRVTRSLDRQTAPEPVTEPITSIPPAKHKHQPKLREPTIPKSETVFIPLPEHERISRPKQPRTTPWKTSPERSQINHGNFQIPHHDPLQLPDYISPYAYHPAKPYREETVHPTTLPILLKNRSERKPRPPLCEPRYRWAPHSLERYLVQPIHGPRLWDYQYQAQSDDDDDINALDSSREKRKYRRFRPRTPWIPVW